LNLPLTDELQIVMDQLCSEFERASANKVMQSKFSIPQARAEMAAQSLQKHTAVFEKWFAEQARALALCEKRLTEKLEASVTSISSGLASKFEEQLQAMDERLQQQFQLLDASYGEAVGDTVAEHRCCTSEVA